MEHRTLGATGIEVSALCFGTWEIGGLYWGQIDQFDSVNLLRRAFDLGVTTYDASDVYGNGRSEVLLSAAFHGRRQDVVYISKAGYLVGLDGAQAARMRPEIGGRDRDFSPEYLRWALEMSLRRLNTDYLDVWLLHDAPAEVLAGDEVWETLRAVQQEGKVRAYGASTGAAGGVTAIQRGGAQVIEVPFSLLLQDAAARLFPLAGERRAGILSRTPFAGGRLFRGGPDVQAFGYLFEGQASPAAAALRYVLSHPVVSSVVTGIMREAELEQNAAACQPPYFDAAVLRRAAVTPAEQPTARG
jgi:aryl-alcohol dehydrogenase-like predicted oxidoreductase